GNHALATHTDCGARRGIAPARIRERVGSEIARGVLRNSRGARTAGATQAAARRARAGARAGCCRPCSTARGGPDRGRACDGLGCLRARDCTTRSAHVELLENLGVLPELRRDLHDDVILLRTEGVVDGRDLCLCERIAERIVYLTCRETETRGRIAIHDQVR